MVLPNTGLQAARCRAPESTRWCKNMKKKGCLIAVVVLVLVIGWLLSPLFFTVNRMHRIAKRVDHSGLLAACQTMMKNRTSYKTTFDSPEGQSNVDLHDSSVPAIIRGLNPSYVLVQDDVATVEMGGGFGHYGVVAFAHGNDTTNRIPGWGKKERKLIEGLWYYSD